MRCLATLNMTGHMHDFEFPPSRDSALDVRTGAAAVVQCPDRMCPASGSSSRFPSTARPVDSGFKRMRVQARQIYAFCHAAELDWNGPALDAAANGISFILNHGWLPDGGWATRLGTKGQQIDSLAVRVRTGVRAVRLRVVL